MISSISLVCFPTRRVVSVRPWPARWRSCCCSAVEAAAQIVPGWNTKQFTLERLDADRIRLMREVEIEGEKGSPNEGQKFFADNVELNTRTGELTASGNVVFSTTDARVSADTVVFNTRTKRGTFTNASGIASLGERGGARSDHVRHARAGRLLLRRSHREDRHRQVPHHARRVHDLRAADAALGDRERQLDRQPARLRAAEQRHHPREGRPGLLPAGDVLPDSRRRPRDRFPAPDLWPIHVPRPIPQQRLLLGHQPEPGRDVLPRLVLFPRPGRRHRVSLHPVAAIARQLPPLRLEGGREHDGRRHQSGPDQLPGGGQRHAGAARRAARARPGGLLLGHHRPAAL